jgi:hypothetical protein
MKREIGSIPSQIQLPTSGFGELQDKSKISLKLGKKKGDVPSERG